jgi:hypothetical protein
MWLAPPPNTISEYSRQCPVFKRPWFVFCYGETPNFTPTKTPTASEYLNLNSLDWYFGSIRSRSTGLAGHVARIGGKSNAFTILVGKPEGKQRLGRTRCKGEYNTKININQIKWTVVDSATHLAQTGMKVSLFRHGIEPSNSVGFG